MFVLIISNQLELLTANVEEMLDEDKRKAKRAKKCQLSHFSGVRVGNGNVLNPL